MPTYDYQCDQCRRTVEVWQRITAEPLTRCESCGGTLRRLLAAAPFILKGAGWYVTDYPSESRKKALAAEKPDQKSGDQPQKSGDQKDGASGEKSSTSGVSSTQAPSGAAASAPQPD